MARRVGPSATERRARLGAPARGSVGPASLFAALRRSASPARASAAAVIVVLGAVAAIGALTPARASGLSSGAAPSGAASSGAPVAAASQVGAAWSGAGGLDVLDLVTKGGLVLILLFITLRVLGRMQASSPKRAGRLNVLESRTLASKASLHLVAVGDRRLVVGLTPSGMVALAEMDASEIEEAESEQSRAAAIASAGATNSAAGAASAGLPASQFATTLNSLMAPIDGLTDRLAGFFSGGRARS